ncbi:DUF2397 domain-containing protein [Kibdelosporangium philippinense]|uniref:DUF2397 domain-containing protein n=1 Tax=Kibdelosporangium philippinense TaxID=211113 RepID=A0ABS8ZW21_9PSEU|nr:DUF2397 family protein [Kibdelosporangium philippinense]MCE7011812.1 DUF2397 domain-containing protein [Kibdelosporangium philippinense]
MTTWWRRIEPDLWRFASTPSEPVREAHAAILGALLVASTRAPMVTLTEIQVLLVDLGFRDRMSNEELRDILDHFVDAELVKPFKDYTAPVASLSDGTRRQEAWALTKKGRVIVRAVRNAVSSLDRTLQLPPRLLDAVHDTVHDLIKHSRDDVDRLATDLAQVRAHLDQLVSATGDFYGAVAALVQFDVTDDTVFLSSRERILSALGQFARSTERSLVRVRDALMELRAIGHVRLVERGLRGAGVLDPYGQQAWADEMKQHLDDLDRWFEPRGSIERLIDSAAGAIHTLLGAIDRRYYANTRGSDLGSDFRQIARMLHVQPSDAAAYQVFSAAFGMWPASHPRRPAVEDIATAVRAADSTPDRADVTLREHDAGAQSSRRPRKIPDVAKVREAAEAQKMFELLRLSDLSADLITPGVVTLEHFTNLDAEHTTVLVELIEEAMVAFDTSTGFGVAATLRCQLRLCVGEPGRKVTVQLAEGTLTAPDLRVEIRSLDADSHGKVEVA